MPSNLRYVQLVLQGARVAKAGLISRLDNKLSLLVRAQQGHEASWRKIAIDVSEDSLVMDRLIRWLRSNGTDQAFRMLDLAAKEPTTEAQVRAIKAVISGYSTDLADLARNIADQQRIAILPLNQDRVMSLGRLLEMQNGMQSKILVQASGFSDVAAVTLRKTKRNVFGQYLRQAVIACMLAAPILISSGCEREIVQSEQQVVQVEKDEYGNMVVGKVTSVSIGVESVYFVPYSKMTAYMGTKMGSMVRVVRTQRLSLKEFRGQNLDHTKIKFIFLTLSTSQGEVQLQLSDTLTHEPRILETLTQGSVVRALVKRGLMSTFAVRVEQVGG